MDKLSALEGVTMNEPVAAQITAMYTVGKAFFEALYNEKVRKAFCHKVRAMERRYTSEKQV